MKPIDQYHQRVREALEAAKYSKKGDIADKMCLDYIDQAVHDLFVALVGEDKWEQGYDGPEEEGRLRGGNEVRQSMRQAIKPLGGEK